MSKSSFLIIGFILIVSKSFSQAQTCICLENLNVAIIKTEANYAGFPNKVNSKTKSTYIDLVNKLKYRAKSIVDPKRCFTVIKDYVIFFKDKHSDISYALNDKSDWEIQNISSEDFIKQYNKEISSPIEGIWVNPDSSLNLEIKKTATNTFKGIITKSRNKDIPVGLVYFTLTKNNKGFSFIKYNTLTKGYPAKQTGNLLRLWNVELWGKISPVMMSANEKTELATWNNYNFGLDFEKLNNKTSYIKIPSFNRDDMVQKLVSENDSIIRNAENLIIDLRSNGGGNTGWSYLLPYFITQPIKQGDNYLRLSEDNNKKQLAEMEPLIKNPISEDMKKYFTDDYMVAYKKAFSEIQKSKNQFYPIPSITIPLDSITKKPKKITLIFDELCGSSTEYFFYLSKQSSKIITYGVNTLGMMDYVGMHEPTKLPFNGFHLVIPNTKSSWTDASPIDQIGFKPAVSLQNIPYNKWLDFVMKDIDKR